MNTSLSGELWTVKIKGVFKRRGFILKNQIHLISTWTRGLFQGTAGEQDTSVPSGVPPKSKVARPGHGQTAPGPQQTRLGSNANVLTRWRSSEETRFPVRRLTRRPTVGTPTVPRARRGGWIWTTVRERTRMVQTCFIHSEFRPQSPFVPP